MGRILRLAGIVVVVLGASAVPSTAAPTLGGRIAPATIIFERQPFVAITNLSTLPVTVTLEATTGWTVESDTFPLEVGERHQTSIIAAGSEDGTISARLTPSDVLSGVDYSSLVLAAKVRHERPWESLDAPWWPFVGLVALLPVVAVLRRHRES